MPRGYFQRPEKYNTVVNYDTKINIRISSEKLEQIREIAKNKNMKYNQLIRDIIDDYINKEKSLNKKLEPKNKNKQ